MRRAIALVALALMLTLAPTGVRAETPAKGAFLSLWQRSDLPVARQDVQRSWLWGNGARTDPLVEAYADSPGGVRVVQYYDKARMEITNPKADESSPWYVTNGLLTRELVSGRLQLGDDQFDDTGHPAQIPVAGDPSNTFPTYADLGGWVDHPAPDRTGSELTRQLTPTGEADYAPAEADPLAVAAHYVTYTGGNGQQVGYNIPEAFWEFMTQSGTVYEGGQLHEANPLFDWLFVLGYPIGEPFWCQVSLAGVPTWVMVQPFERRVLTYTPSNPDGWKVEMGNIGQHYHTWRYQTLQAVPTPTSVVIGDFYYNPQTLTVPTGTTVVWSVSGDRAHTVIANDGSWVSGELHRGQIFAHRFDSPGVYGYHSRDYSWMTGTIVVEGPASAPDAAPAPAPG